MKTKFTASIVRVAIALATLAPFTLRAYIVGPPEGLDKMTTNADLICKARVVSSTIITNAAFQALPGFATRASRLEVISILKGSYSDKSLVFLHYASHPDDRRGRMYAPQHYELETGQSYLVFAVKTDREGEFRQIRLHHTGKEDEGVLHTLDDRPLNDRSIKDAHWIELELLLNSANPTNQLYAVHQLEAMSRSGGGFTEFNHANDFKRDEVLKTLQPLISHTNEEVAIAALNCFRAGPESTALIEPYAETLVQTARNGAAIPRRVAAMSSFSGTRFMVVSNALPQWLGDPSEAVRLQAVSLLPNFPGEFSENALRKLADDPSPKIRAGVADAIGNGKIESLVPTLKTLLSDPVGRTNPVPPLTTDELRGGGRVWGGNNNDVHTAAGYALLKFDVSQVGDILRANLDDEGFRPNYLCKLAEAGAGLWLTNLVEMLEARRIRVQKEVDASGAEPKANYFKARMALTGTYFNCWNSIYNYLRELPASDFAEGRMNRTLDALEMAGNTGSQEPMKLYELYRIKGLNQRAEKFRSANDNQAMGFDINLFYDRVDVQNGILNAAAILAIARQLVSTNDTWIDKAEFETPERRADGSGWSVHVWRLPKTPGGDRLIMLDPKGRVTDYIRGH